MLFTGKFPCLINLGVEYCDVRNVARAFVAALESDEDGRFLLKDGFFTFGEMSAVMRDEFQPMGYKFPSWTVPDFLMHTVAFFGVKSMKMVTPRLGFKQLKFDCSRAKEHLGVRENEYTLRQTLVAMAHQMIQSGALEKKVGYRSKTEF